MSFNEFLNCIRVKNVKAAYPDFDNLLSRAELMNVYTGMSRANDFSDANKILSDVCKHKRELKPGNAYLSAVKLTKSLENLRPPINSYEYIFTDALPITEGSVNPGTYGDRESGNYGRYDEPIFSGKCIIL